MTYTVASSCFCTSPLAVMTVVGLHDFVKVSISAIFKSFFLVICIDAPESHNKFSFLRSKRVDAGRHQFSEGEKMLFYFYFQFVIFLPTSTLLSRAHGSCHSVSSWDRSSNFGALALRWWGSPGQIILSEGFWSRMLVWRATAFVNFTHRIGFRMSEVFRKIDEDFGGSMSWKTKPNCRVIFNTATALLSPFFQDLLQGCSSAWRCA